MDIVSAVGETCVNESTRAWLRGHTQLTHARTTHTHTHTCTLTSLYTVDLLPDNPAAAADPVQLHAGADAHTDTFAHIQTRTLSPSHSQHVLGSLSLTFTLAYSHTLSF